ncbi:MAG: zeta toxin [Bacteroidetes bacterium]|nr:zeta toxin [Bacteroidota bacterium]
MTLPHTDSVPTMYIIGGCNGAGKTTASFTVLPELLHCYEFVNADEIAKGLSPFRPESVAIEAGRLMLHRIEELMNQRVDFAFETTLAASIHLRTIAKAQTLGYRVHLLFFWLESVELAQQRVQSRVKEGGHSINVDVVNRRYKRGIVNLFQKYWDRMDCAWIIDGSKGNFNLIVERKSANLPTIFVPSAYESIQNQYVQYSND